MILRFQERGYKKDIILNGLDHAKKLKRDELLIPKNKETQKEGAV